MVNNSKLHKIQTINLNFGPQHPSAHGVLRLLLSLDGEIIVRADPHIGLLHRGTEKLVEYKNFLQVLPYLDRLDYVSMMAQEHAYSLLIEKITFSGIQERVSYIRVIFCEITRILNHLMSITTHALDVGAVTPFLWAFEEREKLMELYERVSGARMHASFIRPGGISMDLPLGIIDDIASFIKQFPSRLAEMQTLLTDNRIWQQRLVGVGVITQQQAVDFAFSGVMLRSTGICWDLRLHATYEIYSKLKFKVPTAVNGDCYDRYILRMEEMYQSLIIIEQCLLKLPTEFNFSNTLLDSPSKKDLSTSMEAVIRHFKHCVTGYKLIEGQTYVSVEAPKGEFGLWLSSTKNSFYPYRLKIRSPGYFHLQGLESMVVGSTLSDAVTVIGTQDIVFGEVDR